MERRFVTVEGNEAAAYVAHQANEVIAIYPITPASPMGEMADAWSAAGRQNIFGTRARSHRDAERGRRGRRRPRRLAGRRPGDDVHRLAGPAADDPQHVQDRRRADARRSSTSPPGRWPPTRLSIFGDHSDVMAAAVHRLGDAGLELGPGGPGLRPDRPGGHAASRASRSSTSSTASGPRTRSTRSSSSTPDDIRAMIDEELVRAHRDRRPVAGPAGAPRLGPEPGRLLPGPRGVQPVLPRRCRASCRGRWTASPGSSAGSTTCSTTSGAPDAERVIVMMGSGAGAVEEAVEALVARGREGRAGQGPAVPAVRRRGLPRGPAADDPADRGAGPDQGAGRARRAALPGRRHRPGRGAGRARGDGSGCPGSSAAATACPPRSSRRPWPRRSSTSSAEPEPKRHFTVGIVDDVTHLSLQVRPDFTTERRRRHPGRLLRARQRRHGRGEQELGQDHRREHAAATPRATSSTTRRSRARRPSPTCGSARGRSDSSYLIRAGQLRGLPPVRLPGADRRAGGGRARGDLPAEQPLSARTRSGTSCRPRSRSRSSTRS